MDSRWEGSKLIVTFYGVFTGSKNLTSITLPKEVKIIGENAFYECSQLRSIILPDGLIEFHSLAFRFCTALTSISLPDGLKVIDNYVFESTGLASIHVPGSVKNIGLRVFYDCNSLRSVVLKEGVETVEEMAFYSCAKLEDVTLPSSLKKIGISAFSNCGSPLYKLFKTITIPASVTSIENSAFYESNYLEEVIMLSATPPSLGNMAFHVVYNGPPSTFRIKVPAASLNAYKTADRWKEYANNIIANTN